MIVDVIVPVCNLLDKTILFINSLVKQSFFNLIIIDNGSDKETQLFLQTLKQTMANVIIVRNEINLGYIKAINQGLRLSKAPFVMFANNDIIMPDNLLERLREALKSFDVVSPLSNNIGNNQDVRLIQFNRDPSIANINDFASNLYNARASVEDIDYVYGHCMMATRKVIQKVGLLDERFGIGNYDDVDFCKRATSAGFRVGICKNLFVYHFRHSTFNKLNMDIDGILSSNQKEYNKKWSKKEYL